jgi:hypothetical protein
MQISCTDIYVWMLHFLMVKLLLRNDERRKRSKDGVKIPVFR